MCVVGFEIDMLFSVRIRTKKIKRNMKGFPTPMAWRRARLSVRFWGMLSIQTPQFTFCFFSFLSLSSCVLLARTQKQSILINSPPRVRH